jgi:hypothetical protein
MEEAGCIDQECTSFKIRDRAFQGQEEAYHNRALLQPCSMIARLVDYAGNLPKTLHELMPFWLSHFIYSLPRLHNVE